MAKQLKAIRGMNDILPEQTPVWRYLEDTVKNLLSQYGYREIRMPIVEQTELFKRSIGEVTDIVEKEMYTFDDRNGDSLTLRPEGTAGCVRAGQEHGLLFNQVQRLWYTGPMFRHERPQKGRYRQFHQIGVETFGMNGPDIDAEVIIMTARLWQQLGLGDAVTLHLNTLGTPASRAAYREALVDYLNGHFEKLDDDSQRRLESNPLRVLDSKDEGTQEVLKAAPKLYDYLDQESLDHFEGLKSLLDAAGVKYVVTPTLVRGLDYYCKTVFEWITDRLGAQGTVCGGGRYDGLAEQLGGKPTPAMGFAMGVERLILMLETLDVIPAKVHSYVDVYVATMGDVQGYAMQVADQLRAEGVRVLFHCGGGKFQKQMKKADASGATWALIIGEQERDAGEVVLKSLRTDAPQQKVRPEQLRELLQS